MFAQSSFAANSALISFAIYTLLVFALAVLSSRFQSKGGFLSEYFLGSRGLGMWAFALTFAATSASGGSFMGFPSKIYSHGWVLALWIGSYMLVPVLAMALFGKRLNQMGRVSGAITIPDVLRARFDSRAFGALATLLIIFFMAFNLVAQFKAGALMLKTLLDDVPLFQSIRTATGQAIQGMSILGAVEPGYLICLSFFAVAVIFYTSYGGFRAVVWTDVLQGFVMLIGVLIMLPLALHQVGGLTKATKQMTEMTPPVYGTAMIEATSSVDKDTAIPFGTWLECTSDGGRQVFRTAQRASISAGQTSASFVDSDGKTQAEISVLEITTPAEIDRIEIPQRDVNLTITPIKSQPYAFGHRQKGVYVMAPGPSPTETSGFLPLSVAISFFFFWTFVGAGQPSNMVRLMAFNSATTFRRAISTVAIYYSLIYFPLVVIFCCARVLLPGMEIESDRIMPAMAEHLTTAVGYPWLAGLLVAAPFAAVMSTVDSFLLMISSAVVRDVYQRELNPDAAEKTLIRLTYTVTAVVGLAAFLGALNPPAYLQDIIVFTGGGLAACFLAPVALGLYWSRFNAAGAIAGMLGGFLAHVALYGIGFQMYGRFKAYQVFGFDPFLPETAIALLVAVGVALMTKAPNESVVRKFFYRK